MSRRYNLRGLGKGRTYTAPELALALDVHLATVRRWSMDGLKPIERRRPFLFHGAEVAEFLAARARPRQPLEPGQIYCTPCKRPRLPVGALISLFPRSATTVDFTGACPVCGRAMFRRVRITEIAEKLGSCRIAAEDGSSTMVRGGDPAQAPVLQEALS